MFTALLSQAKILAIIGLVGGGIAFGAPRWPAPSAVANSLPPSPMRRRATRSVRRRRCSPCPASSPPRLFPWPWISARPRRRPSSGSAPLRPAARRRPGSPWRRSAPPLNPLTARFPFPLSMRARKLSEPALTGPASNVKNLIVHFVGSPLVEKLQEFGQDFIRWPSHRNDDAGMVLAGGRERRRQFLKVLAVMGHNG